MNKSIFYAGLLAATVFSNATLAAPPKENGFYIGGAVGVTELDDDGAFAFNGLSFDDTDASFVLFGGYKFLRYFALEGRVSDLGSYSVGNGVESESIGIDVISAQAVGIIPFGESGWELFGQLGLGRADIDCTGCTDETVGSAGVGVRFFPTEHLSVGFQIDAFAYEDDSLASQTFDIGVGTSQLSLQYLF